MQGDEFLVALEDLTEANDQSVIIHRGGWVLPECFVRSQLGVKDSSKPEGGFWCFGDGSGEYFIIPEGESVLLWPENSRNCIYFIGNELDDMYLAVDYHVKHGEKVMLCLIGYADPKYDTSLWREVAVDEIVPSDQNSEKFLFNHVFKQDGQKWVVVDLNTITDAEDREKKAAEKRDV